MSTRRVSNPLALAVLACLAEKPMHPYEMAATMRMRHQDDAIKLNYGSLYSVIEALCRHKLIVPKETLREGRRPERTVFMLTEAGSLELSDWLGELLAEPAKEYSQFEAGLALMPVLSPEEVLVLFKRRVELLELELAKARSVMHYVHGQKLARLFSIEQEFRIAQREAELNWVRDIVAELAAGTLEGLEKWQGWHATAKAERPAPE